MGRYYGESGQLGMPPRLIFEQAISRDADGNLTSYWPEKWPLNALAKLYFEGDPVFFAASYQNSPYSAEGDTLKAEWIHTYTPEELVQARAAAGVSRGVVSVGVDTASGGEENGDWSCGVAVERIGRFGFLTNILLLKVRLEVQAEKIEQWMEFVDPDFITIEDMASKGYVYGAFAQLNGGRGSRFPIHIEKPQGRAAIGNKEARFLTMAPRFEFAQIRVPAGKASSGGASVHPDWLEWWIQWTTFPGNHDDALDATFWAVQRIFRDAIAVGIVADSSGKVLTQSDEERILTEQIKQLILCDRRHHRGYGKSVDDCENCQLNSALKGKARADRGRVEQANRWNPSYSSSRWSRSRQ